MNIDELRKQLEEEGFEREDYMKSIETWYRTDTNVLIHSDGRVEITIDWLPETVTIV